MENRIPDFENTEIAFASKTDAQLKETYRLFQLMNNAMLVRIGQKIAIPAVKYHFPFASLLVRKTIFKQFCGGTSLLDSLPVIEHLQKYRVRTILDYGAEGKEKDEDFNKAMNETVRALEFAKNNPSIKAVSTKVTGLTYNNLLVKLANNAKLNTADEHEHESLRKRLDVICNKAEEVGVELYIDAEESWLQGAIDNLVINMMRRYNKNRAIVFNTYQMYRHDRLKFLKDTYEDAKNHGYFLGVKLVRGAYLEKENKRAAEKNYPSPINATKELTDQSYNNALEFCIMHIDKISFVNASHNVYSNLFLTHLMNAQGLPTNHPHIHFSQLYGMSDILTFNLAINGYSASKYLPYGHIEDVIPYLIRRTQENSSITGDMSRELLLIHQEMKRRGLIS